MATSNKKRTNQELTNEYIEDIDQPSRKRQKIMDFIDEQQSYQISALPREIKNQISNFLDDKSKRMMRASSTEWFKIINYDDFTIYFARPSTLPSLIQTFQRYSKPIGLQFEKTISFDNTFTKLAVLTNLTRLEIPNFLTEDSVVHFTALTALQNLTFKWVSYTPLVFNHFPNLTHIAIRSLREVIERNHFQLNPKINIIQKLHNVTRLRSLDIWDHYDFGSKVLEYDTESVSKMSNLSKLSVFGFGAMLPFTKLPNLEYLKITSDTPDDFSLASTKLTCLKVQFSSDQRYNDRLSNCQKIRFLTNLRTLKLRSMLNGSEMDFLTSLTNLESITVDQFETLTESCFRYVNSSKLTSVRSDVLLHADYISHLTSLQVVEIAYTGTPVIFNNVTKLKADVFEAAMHCPNVKYLIIANEDANSPSAHQVIASLSQLESLEVLNADAMAVQHMSGMTNLTRLVVELRTNDNDNYESLKYLTGLKELNFVKEHNGLYKLVGVVPALISLTNLERLSLSHISLDDNAVQAFEALPRLKGLSVDYEGDIFDESKLSNLTNLQRLTLRNVTSRIDEENALPCRLTQLSYLYHYQNYWD